MTRFAKIAAAAVIALGAGTLSASAACNGDVPALQGEAYSARPRRSFRKAPAGQDRPVGIASPVQRKCLREDCP